MDVEAEEMEEDAVDLSVGVVFSKKYEEPESRGSAANFSLGVAMESDSSGGEGSADDALLKINDSNKCHCLSQIQSPTAVNDDQVETKSTTALNDDNPDIDGEVEDDVLVDADVTIAVDNVHDLLAAALDVDMLVDHSHDFEATAPVEDGQVEDNLTIDKHQDAKEKAQVW
jgi:hypothetical protein